MYNLFKILFLLCVYISQNILSKMLSLMFFILSFNLADGKLDFWRVFNLVGWGKIIISAGMYFGGSLIFMLPKIPFSRQIDNVVIGDNVKRIDHLDWKNGKELFFDFFMQNLSIFYFSGNLSWRIVDFFEKICHIRQGFFP